MTKNNSDDKVHQRTRRILRKDKDLRGYDLNTDVVNGEVQLQGVVDTLQEKERAEELVRGVPGVKGVAGAVSISTDGAITDKDVIIEVKEELESAPDVDLHHIGVASVNAHGKVVLRGRTSDPAKIDAAVEAASKARGVTKVVSQVKLSAEELSLEDIFHSQVRNDQEK